MKTLPLVCLLVCPLIASAAEIKIGDSAAAVRTELGAPRGQVHRSDRDLFYYDRGEIEVRAGVVTRVTLRSPQEQAAFESKRAVEAARIRDEQEIRRARLLDEGEALKARKLADPAFLAAPASYQVAFWTDFSQRYAGVPCGEELNLARTQLSVQVADARAKADEAQRLTDLESRVAAAEASAADSEARLLYARNYYPSSYPYRNRHDYQPFSPALIEYHFYESPLPYATSPGIPPVKPKYEKNSAPSTSTRTDDNWRYAPTDATDWAAGAPRGTRRVTPEVRRY